MALPPHEWTVLQFLAENSSVDERCWPFNSIANRVGLDRTQVKRACRKLARRGYAQCVHGLWTDDGTHAGSGYGVTDAGVAAFQQAGAAA